MIIDGQDHDNDQDNDKVLDNDVNNLHHVGHRADDHTAIIVGRFCNNVSVSLSLVVGTLVP